MMRWLFLYTLHLIIPVYTITPSTNEPTVSPVVLSNGRLTTTGIPTISPVGTYIFPASGKMNFTTAEAYCISQGTHLATILDKQSHDYIISQISSDLSYRYWIGLTHQGINSHKNISTYSWIDGTSFNRTSFASNLTGGAFPWNRDPSNPNYADGDSCVIINALTHEWDDKVCTSLQNVICNRKYNETTNIPTTAPNTVSPTIQTTVTSIVAEPEQKSTTNTPNTMHPSMNPAISTTLAAITSSAPTMSPTVLSTPFTTSQTTTITLSGDGIIGTTQNGNDSKESSDIGVYLILIGGGVGLSIVIIIVIFVVLKCKKQNDVKHNDTKAHHEMQLSQVALNDKDTVINANVSEELDGEMSGTLKEEEQDIINGPTTEYI